MDEAVGSKSISFRNLEIGKRRVSLIVSYERGEFELWYEFDREIYTTPSLVALAISPLCGTVFDHIAFDFEITPDVFDCIKSFTRADVSVPACTTVVTSLNPNRKGVILSFSGGFDSIAAKELMPDDTHLVSLDLGGWFKREASYFKKFNTITVTTNIRQVPDQLTALARNNWLFMASGALLCSYHLNAKFHEAYS